MRHSKFQPLSGRHHSSLGTETHSLRDLPDEIIQAYGSWIGKYLDHGWDGYLVTFMFQHVSGSVKSKVQQMHKEIDKSLQEIDQ